MLEGIKTHTGNQVQSIVFSEDQELGEGRQSAEFRPRPPPAPLQSLPIAFQRCPGL